MDGCRRMSLTVALVEQEVKFEGDDAAFNAS